MPRGRRVIDKSDRRCSICGTAKTSIQRRAGTHYVHNQNWTNHSDSERWLRDGKGGWLCNGCYCLRNYYIRRELMPMTNIAIENPTLKLLSRLRYTGESFTKVVNRVIGYYIQNRFDPETRKEILAN